MNNYILTPALEAFAGDAAALKESGLGAVSLLVGPPGAGKTSYAEYIAELNHAELYRYDCTEFKTTDLLYAISLDGVVTRERGWVKGPAWLAFEKSRQGGEAVLLIDEVDKTSRDSEPVLLRPLENFSFQDREGKTILGDPRHIIVIITSNGQRDPRPETLRRCQRIVLEFPSEERIREIIYSILPSWKPSAHGELVALASKMGRAIFQKEANQAPSPKELAKLCVCAIGRAIREGNEDLGLWQELGLSYLVKMDLSRPGVKAEAMKLLVDAFKGYGLGSQAYNWAGHLRRVAESCLAKK